MQNPYNRYQTNKVEAPKNKKKSTVSKPKKINRTKVPKKRQKGSINLSFIVLSFLGLSLSFYIFAYTEDFLSLLSRVEVGFSSVMAADEEKSASKSSENKEDIAALPVGKASSTNGGDDQLTMKNASVFKALKEKRRELEKKERRLARLEEDLQKQKLEIEKQLKEMKEMRRNISSKLDKKVIADQESVTKLVGVYSNMKPQNAATILTNLDEQLAIKVLAKMKKQNAAAILNFVEPKKAQTLSEKYAGLKK